MFLHFIHKVGWISLKVKLREMISDFILLTLLFLGIFAFFWGGVIRILRRASQKDPETAGCQPLLQTD
jgi:hypothetical protein